MIAKQPQKTYKFGDSLPPIPGPVASWPWPGSAALTKWSIDMLHYPLGTIITDVVDGHPVIAQIQTHSWYGAHPDWPSTPHKGTSVFVPTTVNATGKKIPVADPPDGWGEESPSVAGVGSNGKPATPCAPGDPLCTDLPDESAPHPTKEYSMDTVFLNGRPVSFGVGENFCPTLPYVCPPRPWGPDPGPRASIADRLGTGDRDVGVSGCCPRQWEPDPGQTLSGVGDVAPPAPTNVAQIHNAAQAAVKGRPQAPHPAVQGSIQAAATGAARVVAPPGTPPAQVHRLARLGAEASVLRAGSRFAHPRHPVVSTAIRAAAHEAVLAHAWRPEWGTRPAGFGATQWRPEWGARPVWFGARRWRREWGFQPAWWAAHQTVMDTPQPDDSTTPSDGSPASSDGSPAPTDGSAPADGSQSPTTTAPSGGLSTLAKVGIGVAVVAVVGGTVAAISANGGKKKKSSPAAGTSP